MFGISARLRNAPREQEALIAAFTRERQADSMKPKELQRLEELAKKKYDRESKSEAAHVLRLAHNAGLDDAELDELVRARGGKTEAEYQEMRRELESVKEELRGLVARLESL